MLKRGNRKPTTFIRKTDKARAKVINLLIVMYSTVIVVGDGVQSYLIDATTPLHQA